MRPRKRATRPTQASTGSNTAIFQEWMLAAKRQVSGLGFVFQASGFGCQVSGFKFWVSGLRFQV